MISLSWTSDRKLCHWKPGLRSQWQKAHEGGCVFTRYSDAKVLMGPAVSWHRYESGWGHLHKEYVESALPVNVRWSLKMENPEEDSISMVNLHQLLLRCNSYKSKDLIFILNGYIDPRLLCMYEFQRCSNCLDCLWTVLSSAHPLFSHQLHVTCIVQQQQKKKSKHEKKDKKCKKTENN